MILPLRNIMLLMWGIVQQGLVHLYQTHMDLVQVYQTTKKAPPKAELSK